MANDKYEHRNGETESPTESGWYWFSGESDAVDMPSFHGAETQGEGVAG